MSAIARTLLRLEGSLPFVSRRRYRREVAALRQAAEALCGAVEEATRASLTGVQRWQRVALAYRRERDEARTEIDRLRATIASLVLESAMRVPRDPGAPPS
jgi:hypothetical protein